MRCAPLAKHAGLNCRSSNWSRPESDGCFKLGSQLRSTRSAARGHPATPRKRPPRITRAWRITKREIGMPSWSLRLRSRYPERKFTFCEISIFERVRNIIWREIRPLRILATALELPEPVRCHIRGLICELLQNPADREQRHFRI